MKPFHLNFVFLGVTFFALVLGVSTLYFPRLKTDTAIYTYIAKIIIEGGIPYRDAWDVKGPGIFYVYSICLLVFGTSDIALRIFDLLWQLGTGLVLYNLGVRIFGKVQAGIIAGLSYLLTYFSHHFMDLANADGYLSLPLSLGILFFLRSFDSEPVYNYNIGLSGFFIGVACLFKLPLGLLGVPILLFTFLSRRNDKEGILNRTIPLAIGFGVPILLSCGFLYTRGGLKEYLITQFLFAPEYVSSAKINWTFSCFVDRFLHPEFFPGYFMLFLTALWIGMAIFGKKKISHNINLLLAWLGITIFVLFWHGKFHSVHFLPPIAPLALLSAGAFDHFSQIRTLRASWLYCFYVGVISLFLLIPILRFQKNIQFLKTAFNKSYVEGPWKKLGNNIKKRTNPEDRIFVWGNVPLIYLKAERKSASRFINTGFLSSSWRSINFKKILMDEFEENNPKYFILIKEKGNNACFEIDPGSVIGFQQFHKLKDIIEKNYKIEEESNLYVLYRQQ